MRRPIALVVSAAAMAAAAPSLADASSTAASSPATERLLNGTSSFFSKFDSYGPTLTLTIRDPSRTALLSGAGRSSSIRGKLWPKKSAQPVEDDGAFGLTSKVAALFQIPTSASTTNGQVPPPSRSQFADGFMLDDGEVILDPPSSSTITSDSSSARGLFSIRDIGGGFFGGGSRQFSDIIQNVHPELRQEIKTYTKPFPSSAPWLSGLSCGMIWSPFPLYKAGYPDGYGHKLMSFPHHIQCGVHLSLPRIAAVVKSWRSTSRGITNTFTENDGPRTRDLDLSVKYQESPYREGGTLELILGKMKPYLSPPKKLMEGIRNNPLLQQPRNNHHILVRLATGGGHKGKTIEYAKASFRMPTPFFLRNRYNDRLSVSPSYDFVEETARCTLSGDVGSSGRTRAVLRLDSEEDSTLTVVRALDDSKIIAPTISLNSGKIIYDYHLNLDNISGKQQASHERKVSSSLRAHVDPTKGILLKWTDGIPGGRAGGSCWVTECRIPLRTQSAGPLVADVRVGRRWVI